MKLNKPSSTTIIVSLLLISLSLKVAGDALTDTFHECNTEYSSNSTFQSNLKTLLTVLSSNTSTPSGFFNFTVGKPPNTAYGLYLCRGDIMATACNACVSKAIQELPRRCPGDMEAAIWYDHCMLSYSDYNIFSMGRTVPILPVPGNVNVSEPDRFKKVLAKTVMEIAPLAARSNNSIRKFSVKSVEFSGGQKVYALAQCTPDLSTLDCDACLLSIIATLPDSCDGKQEARVVTPSCDLRYGMYPFYNETRAREMGVVAIDIQDEEQPTRQKGTRKNKSHTIVFIIVPTFIVLTLLALSCVILRKVKQKKKLKVNTSVDSLRFNLSTVRAATDNFSDANKLGQGGFGTVFKGRLNDGQDIAVKRLAECSIQGEQEFMNEITVISKLKHKSLVRLLGFCLKGKERLLIYEFVPNSSLDRLLFDRSKSRQLNWVRRYKIINGIARGLFYLHEDSQHNIIHRDMKPGNILLDGELQPKISDFGTARLFDIEKSRYKTERIVGTYGYMAPEYAKYGHISVKTDVFSFGVIVLEIVTGKRSKFMNSSGHMEHLSSYAWKNWREGTALAIVDQSFTGGSKRQILRCINIGLLCVQKNANRRPTMASVVLMLNSSHLHLPSPSKPAFYMHGNIGKDLSESTSNIKEPSPVHSINEASFTDLFPR